MRLKSFENYLIDEELIYNPEGVKPTGTETSTFSNRLVYWNNLPKKFKQGTLTEEEKKDYNRILNARTWWLMTDLENSNIDEKKKKEYQKRFKDFEEALDRAYKQIPDDFFVRKNKKHISSSLRRSSLKGPEKNMKFEPTSYSKIKVKSFANEKLNYTAPVRSKPKEVSEILQKFNDWLETVEMPWNEISSYLGVITKIDQKENPSYDTGEIPKLVGKTLNMLTDLVQYSSELAVGDDFNMSKSEYEEAKSPFGRAKNDAMTKIEKIEEYLYSDYYIPRGGEKYRGLIENKIREIERTFKTKDADSVLKLTEELKKLINEADFRFKQNESLNNILRFNQFG